MSVAMLHQPALAVAWFAVLVVVAQSRRVPVRGRRHASLASKYRSRLNRAAPAQLTIRA